jgi:hypothetical protein
VVASWYLLFRGQRLTGSLVDTNKDSYVPTARAITEHIGALKKEFGGAATTSGTPRAKGTATPRATPRKPAAVKTPKSSAKRKRVSKSSDEDEEMDDGEDDSDAERAMLKGTPSGPRSTLSRRSKSVAKTYNDDDSSSSDELASQGGNTGAVTPTPTAGVEEQPDFFGRGAFDGAGEDVGQMDGVATGIAAGGAVTGTLTPQGRTTNGTRQAKSATKATKRAIKREAPADDSNVSDFQPDFMEG